MSSKTNKQTDTSYWDERRGLFRTSKGGWIIGEAVYNHGYSMMDDLVGHKTFFQVLVLNVTGRLAEKNLADWLEASFICLSWPDPRIWCNKVGTLAGTMQCSPAAAVSVGILAADSRMYASGALVAGAEFIIEAVEKKKAGLSVEEIVNAELEKKAKRSAAKPVIMGYARPIATGDERVIAMERVTKTLGFEIGEHLSLAYEIDSYLQNNYKESINMLGYCVAFMVDQAFCNKEITRLFSTWVNSGVHACYAEARDRAPESFLPLRCDDIEYQGKIERPVPNIT